MKAMMRHSTRRQLFGAAASFVPALWTGRLSSEDGRRGAQAADADPRVRGPFPILSTPFTETGALDFEVLANQARFVDWADARA